MPESQAKYSVIGLMSGTSLDGLDIAHCVFELLAGKWHYFITNAETVPYTRDWKSRLAGLEDDTALGFVQTDIEFGYLLGLLTQGFIQKYQLKPDFIASHGHTIFHQPDTKISCQIGRGSVIAAETGIPVVCDFRSLDVALGGQGAPLVPIGDQLLFGEFDFCLNLGGFANISYQIEGKRVAYDVCPANIVLNKLAAASGYDYDPDGMMAGNGIVNSDLLKKLNAFPYYSLAPPKSLGKEWVKEHVFPQLINSDLPINDLLATFCEHIAIQVASKAVGDGSKKLLITGGGAFNKFLISRIRHHAALEIIIPDSNTINFKESLIFAFLGVLRWRNEVNCLQSVTGASKDSSGGAIYSTVDNFSPFL